MLLTVLLDENVSADVVPVEISQNMVAGGPAQIAEEVKAKAIDAGIDGLIINMPFYRAGVITAAAEALHPVVGS
jgi:hypothetical protein